MDNYTRSKKSKLPTVNIRNDTKKVYADCRHIEVISEFHLKRLSDLICRDFGVESIPVEFEGREPHKKRGGKLSRKPHGIFSQSGFGTNRRIHIYKYTAARQQIRASKAATSTLLHEIIHYFDYEITKLSNSIHSSGFYQRISQLQDMLS